MGSSKSINKIEEKLLTTREVSQILGLSEKEVIELAEAGKISHYKVAGEFLRFKKEEILKVRRIIQRELGLTSTRSLGERIRDFFYFNDFYIISFSIILILLWFILKS
jgi:excisionase family DNA binding protein